jgi:hypothetical protein
MKTQTGPAAPWRAALKPLDFLFILLSVAVSAGSVVFALQDTGGKPVLAVESPEGEWLYTLDKDADIAIPGLLGDSRLEIRDGRARFLDSPCANKVCVQHTPLSRAGDWSACLPNQVMIRIEGGADSGLDVTVN